MKKILRSHPDFSFEKNLWKKGYGVVAGCDEVGRGCFAGPVVAGACVFSPDTAISTFKGIFLQGIKINDSKKLSHLHREKAFRWIKKNCIWGIGLGSVAEINRAGIVKATDSAFRRAIKDMINKVNIRVEYLLVDAFYIPYMRDLVMPRKIHRSGSKKVKIIESCKISGKQLAIVKGDEKSLSIAAASIVAKVYRDKLMTSLAEFFPDYGWQSNKGYGTKIHRDAIIRFGITKHHRKQFVQTFFNNSSSSQVRSET